MSWLRNQTATSATSRGARQIWVHLRLLRLQGSRVIFEQTLNLPSATLLITGTDTVFEIYSWIRPVVGNDFLRSKRDTQSNRPCAISQRVSLRPWHGGKWGHPLFLCRHPVASPHCTGKGINTCKNGGQPPADEMPTLYSAQTAPLVRVPYLDACRQKNTHRFALNRKRTPVLRVLVQSRTPSGVLFGGSQTVQAR